jgi:Rps23 Pro-64 3,4-dihydroxylase Tpa1-like proline 4-hydroxylase
MTQKVLFTKEECNLILKQYINKPINETENNNNMSYSAKFMTYENNAWILNRIIEWVENELSIKIDWNGGKMKEFYLQSYKKGDKFKKHNDNKHNRVYGAGLLLNDNFLGGEFIVDINKNSSITFNNIAGNCYLFESCLYHEVKEITKGNRNIILIFFGETQLLFKRKILI